MTNPKENEEINEELSTDELKSVSGGIINGTKDLDNQIQGSGSGLTPKTEEGFSWGNRGPR